MPNPAARRVAFRSASSADPAANRIVPPAPGSTGDPTAAGGSLTVSDSAGTGQAVTVPLPPSGWSRIGGATSFLGWRFNSRDPDGPISSIIVKSDRVTVRGGYSNNAQPRTPPPATCPP